TRRRHPRRVRVHVQASVGKPASQVSADDRGPETTSSRNSRNESGTAASVVLARDRDQRPAKVVEFPKGIGSSGWIRTSNPPVNSHFFRSRPGQSETTRADFIGAWNRLQATPRDLSPRQSVPNLSPLNVRPLNQRTWNC